MSRKRFVFGAALLILLASALRFIALTHIPTGLHYDEAANGVLASEIAFRGARPLFITAYTGKEVLWFYLAASILRLLGPTVFSLRLTSALIGILTVAVTGWTVRRLYRDSPHRDWLALLSMALLAVAFWHIVLSRLAFRAISQPLMQALSLGLLWRGLQAPPRRRWIGLALAGVATGLTGYTYLAARLFPIPLALALLVFIIAAPDRSRRLPGLLVYGVSALLTLAPLGWFFFRHPEAFGTRIAQVAPASFVEALAGWGQALGMFFCSGDPLWRFNLPGKPIFGLLLGVFFLLGWGVVVRNVFQAGDALARARGALLIIWPLAMLAPTALATGGITPSNLRAVGLLPLIVLYPALGLVSMAGWLRDLFGFKHVILAGRGEAVALVAVAVLGGTFALRDTLRWGAEPTLYYDNDGHVAAVAHYLNGPHPPATVYVATHHLQHPTLAFLTDDYKSLHTLVGGRGLVLAPSGDTLAIYTRDARPPEDWLSFLGRYLVASPPGPDGKPDFYAYLLPQGFESPLPLIEAQNVANLIVLEGAAAHPAVSGSEASVDLAWRVLASADQPDYAFSAEVCDAWGWCWPRANLDGTLERGRNASYNSGQWVPGERLLTRLKIPLPEGIPPGVYAVRLRIYSETSGRFLPIIDATGGFVGLYSHVEGLEIEANPEPQLDRVPIQYSLSQRMTPSITLLGYDQPLEAVRPGQRLQLALYWLSEGHQVEAQMLTLALSDGTPIYQGDPVHGTHPLSAWLPGELIVDRYNQRLPHDLAPGVYTLTVALGNGSPVSLGTLSVEATDRLFEVPSQITRLEKPILLGGQISLVGYDLPGAPAVPSGDLPLTLAWQAEAEIDASYTVFVHLVDATGTVVAQVDRVPQTGGEAYPSDLWLPGEVLVDTYVLPIPSDMPPGGYFIRVGLYLPDGGQRLSVPGTVANAIHLPEVIVIP